MPLFVAEGSSRDKMRVIRRSEYLSHALEELRQDEAPTVIFGFGFGDSDDHILRALRDGRPRQVAISVYPALFDAERLDVLEARLRHHSVTYFDSTTHPLGAADLNCDAL